MSCGIPSIASKVSGIKDILEALSRTFISPENEESLAEKIRKIYKIAKNNKSEVYRNHILKI